MANSSTDKLKEVALRIREMREIIGLSEVEMAEKTEVTLEEYRSYEAGLTDFPFSFIHKCSIVFGIGISDILEGQSAHLSSYTVTRKGQGQETAKEDGIQIQNLAPMFRQKIAEPYWVRYEYNSDLQNKPIHLTKHSGQEFDFIMSGHLKVQIGDNIEYLGEGDSIYYNSSTPHGMIAVDGHDCLFLAVVLPGEETAEQELPESIGNCKKLTWLELAYCYKLENIDALAQCESLRFLNISYSKVTSYVALDSLPLERFIALNPRAATKEQNTFVALHDGCRTAFYGYANPWTPWRYDDNGKTFNSYYKDVVRVAFNYDYLETLLPKDKK